MATRPFNGSRRRPSGMCRGLTSTTRLAISTPSTRQRARCRWWDDLGRPETALVDGEVRAYDWTGDTFDLGAMTSDGDDVVRFERDVQGRVASATSADGDATFEYGAHDAVDSYRLAHGLEASITYGCERRSRHRGVRRHDRSLVLVRWRIGRSEHRRHDLRAGLASRRGSWRRWRRPATP